MSQPMYRAHIVEYPVTETREVYRMVPEMSHKSGTVDYMPYEYEAQVPDGWEPTADYLERFKTSDWVEPDTSKWFKSRSSAAWRVDLLNDVGYTAIVQRSAPVVWPEHGEKSVDASEVRQVTQAIRVLKKVGLLDSADSLIG